MKIFIKRYLTLFPTIIRSAFLAITIITLLPYLAKAQDHTEVPNYDRSQNRIAEQNNVQSVQNNIQDNAQNNVRNNARKNAKNSVQKSDQSIFKERISINRSAITISECLELISGKGITLSYNADEIDLQKTIQLHPGDYTITELLQIVLNGDIYEIKINERQRKILIIKKDEKYTLSGYIKEAGSMEALIGASITIAGSGREIISNMYGFYSIVLPKGENCLVIQYLGYTPKLLKLDMAENRTLDILMDPASSELKSIVVTAINSQYGTEGTKINIAEVDNMPQLFGTKDFLKQLQMIMGTGGGTSVASRIQVRGGKADNNLVLLDDVPLYNYNHITGFLSVFNSDALKYANFYKGKFPARYSGRLSSVADIRMRDGDMNRYHGGFSVDMLTLSAFAEGPVKREKSSFIVSARRSWVDWFTSIFGKDNKIDGSFYDLNFKVNYSANSRNQFYLSLYSGADRYVNNYFLENAKISWGSKLVSFRWNHIFNNKLFMNTTAYATNFKNKLNYNLLPDNDINSIFPSCKYNLDEYNVTSHLDYYNENYNFKGGVKITANRYSNNPDIHSNQGDYNVNACKITAFVENNIWITNCLKMDIGLNYSFHTTSNSNFHLFDPRIQVSYTPGKQTELYAGFSKMNQFFHQISSFGLAFPYEIRTPSTKYLKPESSMLYEIGVSHRSKDNVHNLHGSIFYNDQKNIITYKATQDINNNVLAPDIYNQMYQGERNGKGIEAQYSGRYRWADLHISSSYSKIYEKFDYINNGRRFPTNDYSDFVFQGYAGFKFNKRKILSVTFSYTSGQYVSIPSYKIKITDLYKNDRTPLATQSIYYYENVNSYKLKDNVQVSIGYTYKKIHSKVGESVLQFGIYNIVGRGAPYSCSVSEGFSFGNHVSLQTTYLPFFAPYISYSFRF